MSSESGVVDAAWDEVRELFASESLHLIGTAPVGDEERTGAAPTDDPRQLYDAWIEAGMHGEMGYLVRNAPLKYRPDRVLAGCRSLLIAAMNYFQVAPEPSTTDAGSTDPARPAGDHSVRPTDGSRGTVARYAWGRDYHKTLGSRLRRIARELQQRFPGETFRPFVDASPISERHFAERAGIGFTGRNTLIITRDYGSWCVLGEVLSTRRFDVDTEASAAPEPRSCPPGCFRCGVACPTGALIAPGRIDARRCISYLTIEHHGSIDEELRPLIGDRIFGCDACQECCPLNRSVAVTSDPDCLQHRAGPSLDLVEILAMDNERFRSRFAGTPVLRTGRDCLVRNAAVVAANTGATRLTTQLRELASDDRSEVVREHARWALGRLAERRKKIDDIPTQE